MAISEHTLKYYEKSGGIFHDDIVELTNEIRRQRRVIKDLKNEHSRS
jgi:hypothetical protein